MCLAPREPSDNLFSPNGHNLFWPQLIICRANVSLVNMHTHTAWRPCVDSNVLYFVGPPSSSSFPPPPSSPPPPPPFPSPRSMLGGFCQYYRKLEKPFPKCLGKKLKPEQKAEDVPPILNNSEENVWCRKAEWKKYFSAIIIIKLQRHVLPTLKMKKSFWTKSFNNYSLLKTVKQQVKVNEILNSSNPGFYFKVVLGQNKCWEWSFLWKISKSCT